MRHDLTDFERAAIRPFVPNKPGGIPRIDVRRVLNGIIRMTAARLTRANALSSTREACKRFCCVCYHPVPYTFT